MAYHPGCCHRPRTAFTDAARKPGKPAVRSRHDHKPTLQWGYASGPRSYSGVVTLAHDVDAALARLTESGLSDRERASLVEAIRASLTQSTSEGSRSAIPFVQAMAQLMIEVEELAANGASGRAVIHHVRAQARRVGLDPIDRAGELSAMDRRRHNSVGTPIGDGTPVVVVRPGYVWHSQTGSVVVAKAVVQDRD